MKYLPTINIYNLSDAEIRKLQPGQWVSAGPVRLPRDRGAFCGVKKSGSVVVAWQGNAQSHKDRKGYRKALMDYAKAW